MNQYTPLQYIQIDIANQFGLDKMQFEDRLSWVISNENILETFEDSADDKYRYAAAVMAYREVQAGKPTGHRVGMDACASGPQIMSAVMRDIVGARNTSLVGNKRNDLYKVYTDTMNKLLNQTIEYDRKEVKYPIMTYFYGSQAKPKQVFGEDTPEHTAFITAQYGVCPGAAYLMPILRNSWNPFATHHSYIMTDGFEAVIPVTDIFETDVEVDELNHLRFNYQYTEIAGKETGLSNIANPIQSIDGFIVRELTRRCDYNKNTLEHVANMLRNRLTLSKESNRHYYLQEIWERQDMLSIVGIEYLTWEDVKHFQVKYSQALLMIIERCLSRPNFPVLCIFDEFTSHPNYVNYIRQTYAEIMAEISDSLLIDDILSQLYGKPIRIEKFADSISDEILAGEYAIS